MKGYKNARILSKIAVREQCTNMTTYVFLLIVFFFLQICFFGGGTYLVKEHQYMNLFEIYVCFMSTRTSQLIYLCAVFVFHGGGPFYKKETTLYLIRSDKKIWRWGKFGYLLRMLIGFQIFLLLSFWVAIQFRITTAGGWSRGMTLSAQSMLESMGMVSIMEVPTNFLEWNPNALAGITFVLATLIGTVTGKILDCFRAGLCGAYGIGFVVILWYSAVLLEDAPDHIRNILLYISPYSLSRLENLSMDAAGCSVWYAILFLGILLYGLNEMEDWLSHDMDFLRIAR